MVFEDLMRRDFGVQKRIILWALGVLLLADLTLAGYSWRGAREETSPKQQLDIETRQYKQLKADVERARAIRKDMPSVQQDCDRFEKGFPPAVAGYSAIVSEIGELARKSGLKLDTLNFKQKDIANRPLTEVQMEAAVSGDYASVVRFVNSLQKSQGLYIVDELTLASQNQTPGQLRVALHMRSYFRTA